MSGVPDLSALLVGQLQLLKKSATKGPTTGSGETNTSRQHDSNPVEQNVDPEPGKKTTTKKVPSSAETASVEEIVPSKGSSKDSKAKKKKRGERSREDSSDGRDRNGMARDSVEDAPDSETPEERPKKKLRKKTGDKVQRSPGSGSIFADHSEPVRGEDEIGGRSPPASLPLADAQGRAEPSGGSRVASAQNARSAPSRERWWGLVDPRVRLESDQGPSS